MDFCNSSRTVSSIVYGVSSALRGVHVCYGVNVIVNAVRVVVIIWYIWPYHLVSLFALCVVE